MSNIEKTEQGPSRKRIRITIPEKELVLRCYENKNGQSWEEVLQDVQDNLVSLPFSCPAVEFYLEQDSNQAINRIRRIVSNELKAATESTDIPVSGSMSIVLSSKMRYAEKKKPEDRYDAKFSHLVSTSSNESAESAEQSDHTEKQAKSKKANRKRKRSKGKGKAEDAHVAMCNKAMKTLDKVNNLLDKYADSSSSSD